MTLATTSADDRHELRLAEPDARAVTLVRAVEETDRAGVLLPLERRRAATAAARAGGTETSRADAGVGTGRVAAARAETGGADADGAETDRADGAETGRAGAGGAGHAGRSHERWLAARARALRAELARELPYLDRFLRWSSPVRGLLGPALAVAFLAGLLTNALGPARYVNVLAVPLLGLVAWNVTVLLLGLLARFLPLGRRALGDGKPRFVRLLEGQARRLLDRLPERGGEDPARAELAKRSLARYLELWLPVAAPLETARGRRLLHAVSLVVIAGVVAGMYLRGLAFRYEATWESTFLSGEAVDALLGVVLAPASWVSGIAIPSAAAIETPAPPGDAAPWIHLYAVTAALFVVLPRAALALVEHLRAARLARGLRLALPAAYLRRLLAAIDTAERRLEVLPYSYRPSARAVETLKQLLYDLFGPRAEIRVASPLDYGVRAEAVEPGTGRLRAVVFGLAQTPEVEVHGELIAGLRDALPDGQTLLAIVDAGPYRERLADGVRGAERLAERRRSWDRVARDAGLAALHVDLSDEPTDDVLARALEAAWPPDSLKMET